MSYSSDEDQVFGLGLRHWVRKRRSKVPHGESQSQAFPSLKLSRCRSDVPSRSSGLGVSTFGLDKEKRSARRDVPIPG